VYSGRRIIHGHWRSKILTAQRQWNNGLWLPLANKLGASGGLHILACIMGVNVASNENIVAFIN
jgi:hypothetical protein